MARVSDMRAWLEHNDGCVFRYLVYKRMFTPFEQKMAYMDESQYETTHYSQGVIEEAVDLGNGDWLLGIREDPSAGDCITYYKLSEIRLLVFKEEERND